VLESWVDPRDVLITAHHGDPGTAGRYNHAHTTAATSRTAHMASAIRVDADLEPDTGSTGGQAIRIGLAVVRGIGSETAQRIVDERDRGGPYTGIDEVARRVQLTLPQIEALATAGAFTPLEPSRRGALWSVGAAARERLDALPGTAMLTPPPSLPGMTTWELMAADLRFTGSRPTGTRFNCCAPTWRARTCCPRPRCREWNTEPACWSVARSPTPSGHRPRGE